MNDKSFLIQGHPKHCYLSVAIPTYNNPELLKNGIESVIGQELFDSCQLLVVDNDSREGDTPTSQLMEKYKDIENILYYRNQTNLGMYGNWNRCFELADSDYVLLLHNDDYLLPGCIKYVVETLKSNSYPALYLNRSRYHMSTNIPAAEKWGKKRKILNKLFNRHKIEHKVILKDTVFGFCLTAPTGFVMRKDVFLKGNSFRLETPKWPSDAEFQLKLASKGILYMSEEILVVKYENGENEGSNKKTTIPLIETHKQLYFNFYKNERYLFKKLLIYVRLRLIAQGFGVGNEIKVRSIIPPFYFTSIAVVVYRQLSKLSRISFILR